jgi:hypothetical protein
MNTQVNVQLGIKSAYSEIRDKNQVKTNQMHMNSLPVMPPSLKSKF